MTGVRSKDFPHAKGTRTVEGYAMHESHKIKEARFFLSEMHARRRDPSAFVHLLSAFLTAARSVAQYAREETLGKAGGQKWYESWVDKNRFPDVAFLKDQRDVNVHAKPVAPKPIFKVEARTTLHISGAADYRVRFLDEQGNPVEVAAPPPPPPVPKPEAPAPAEPEVRYEFAGRPGQDVLALCESYLKHLEAMVQDGQQKSYLTP